METELTDKTPELGDELQAILDASQLNEMQKLFVAHFLIRPIGTKAARKAGYSKKGAHVTASRLLSNVKVRAVLRDCKRIRAKSLGTSKEDIEAFHAEIMHNPLEKTSDQRAAARELARLKGYNDDKINVNLTGSLAERMAAARKRKT